MRFFCGAVRPNFIFGLEDGGRMFKMKGKDAVQVLEDLHAMQNIIKSFKTSESPDAYLGVYSSCMSPPYGHVYIVRWIFEMHLTLSRTLRCLRMGSRQGFQRYYTRCARSIYEHEDVPH